MNKPIARVYYTEDEQAEICFTEDFEFIGRIASIDLIGDMIGDLQKAHDWLVENPEAKSITDFFETLPEDSPHFKIHLINLEIFGDYYEPEPIYLIKPDEGDSA